MCLLDGPAQEAKPKFGLSPASGRGDPVLSCGFCSERPSKRAKRFRRAYWGSCSCLRSFRLQESVARAAALRAIPSAWSSCK
jgi:hypothetical protein